MTQRNEAKYPTPSASKVAYGHLEWTQEEFQMLMDLERISKVGKASNGDPEVYADTAEVPQETLDFLHRRSARFRGHPTFDNGVTFLRLGKKRIVWFREKW